MAARLKPTETDPAQVEQPPALHAEAAQLRQPHGWQIAHTYLVTAAALVIVIAGMRAASGMLVPFLLAIFVAGICAPLYQGMRRRHVPTSLAILAIMLVMLGSVLLLIGVIERAVTGFAGNLPSYQAAFLAQADKLWIWLETKGIWLEVNGIWLEANGIEVPSDLFRDLFNPQALIGHLGAIAATLRDLLTTTFIVVLVAIFILLEGSALPDKVSRLPGFSSTTWARLSQIVADLRRYMFLKTVMSLLTGALVSLWLLLVGVDFPILLGVLSFALNYIPTIGSIVAALPGILLAFIEFGLGTSVITTVAYIVINVGVSNGLEPRYFGMARVVAAGGDGLGTVLGLGARAHGHAALGASDDEPQNRAGERRGHAVDRHADGRSPEVEKAAQGGQAACRAARRGVRSSSRFSPPDRQA